MFACSLRPLLCRDKTHPSIGTVESSELESGQASGPTSTSGGGGGRGAVFDRVLEIARSQHGVAGRTQLVHAGASASMISRWLRSRRLVPFHRGVYAVGHDIVDVRGRWMAAVLSAGGRSALSHRSAGALWGICSQGTTSEVIRSSGPGRSWPGLAKDSRVGDRALRVHRSRVLTPTDFTVRESIPVTTPARTLLDLASTLSGRRLESAVVEAEKRRLIDRRDLEEITARGPGWRGIKNLRRILEDWNGEATHTRSELEIRFLALCGEAAVPSPAVNVLVSGHEVDCLWSFARLVVELDGFAHHSDRATFERDRGRDLDLRRAGYEVVRVTSRMLSNDRQSLIELLRNRTVDGRPRM